MAEYIDRLNLDFDPFDSDGEPSHFFPGGNRQALLDQLVELTCYSSDLAVVTGSLGSGKSTLARWLALSLDDEFLVVQVQSQLFMSAEQLLESICQALSLDSGDRATAEQLLDKIDGYAATLRSRSKTLQLLIDDAHELGGEALQSLLILLARQSDAAQLGEEGIKAVLFGEPMLTVSVQRLAASAPIVLELEPLDADESQDYVEFKLSAAGYQGKLPLDLDAMSVIHSRSQGVPGTIDMLVRDELRRSRNPAATLPKLGFLERHLVPASVGFGALLLLVFFTVGGDDNRGVDGTPERLLATPDPSTGDGNRVRIPLEVGRQAGNPDSSVSAAPVPEPVPTAAETASDAGDRAETGSSGDLLDVAGVTGTPQTALPEPATEISATLVAPSDTEDSAAPLRSATASTADSEGGESSAVPPSQAAGARPVEKGLLAWSPETYTLQVLGSRSEANVQTFIQQNNGAEDLFFFETRYQDRPWFVVVYGNYPNRSAARQAIEQLPQPLKDLQPWARSLADIQSDIRRYQ